MNTGKRWRRLAIIAAATVPLLMAAGVAGAQQLSIDLGGGGEGGTGVSERALQLVALITILSLAPSILVMATSFTRIVVVLSLLRAALGTQTAPPNSVLISLALFLTAFIMAPTFQAAYDTAVVPLIAGEMDVNEAAVVGVQPFRAFMLEHVRERDLQLFIDLSNSAQPEDPDDVSLRALVPAFMISELRRAFEIGFLLFVPFLVIDLVVSSILISMGMMMLPPILVSLPFKLIFFVLIDGWNLISGSLVQSYG